LRWAETLQKTGPRKGNTVKHWTSVNWRLSGAWLCLIVSTARADFSLTITDGSTHQSIKLVDHNGNLTVRPSSGANSPSFAPSSVNHNSFAGIVTLDGYKISMVATGTTNTTNSIGTESFQVVSVTGPSGPGNIGSTTFKYKMSEVLGHTTNTGLPRPLWASL